MIEGVNARYLSPESLPWQPDLLTMDVSFISVTKVLPAVIACMARPYTAVILIKPQFEAGPKDVGKGGIVRDLEVHRRVCSRPEGSSSRIWTLDWSPCAGLPCPGPGGTWSTSSI